MRATRRIGRCAAPVPDPIEDLLRPDHDKAFGRDPVRRLVSPHSMVPFLRILVVVLITAALSATSVGAAHPEHGGDTLGHLDLDVQDLAPGETKVHSLLSEEGPLREGWIYIMYGAVEGPGRVVVNLTFEGEVADQFVWTGGAYHQNSTKIRASGMHDLELWNPTNETLRYAFYYDQSCNCAGKVIPLPGGFVLFNHVFEAGRTVTYDLFVYDEAFTLNAKLASHDPDLPTGHWPTDFEVLDERTVSGKDWINFTFVPETTGTYYVFFEALEGGSPDDPVRLTPLIEVEDEEAAPAPAALLGVLLLVGLLATRRRG